MQDFNRSRKRLAEIGAITGNPLINSAEKDRITGCFYAACSSAVSRTIQKAPSDRCTDLGNLVVVEGVQADGRITSFFGIHGRYRGTVSNDVFEVGFLDDVNLSGVRQGNVIERADGTLLGTVISIDDRRSKGEGMVVLADVPFSLKHRHL